MEATEKPASSTAFLTSSGETGTPGLKTMVKIDFSTSASTDCMAGTFSSALKMDLLHMLQVSPLAVSWADLICAYVGSVHSSTTAKRKFFIFYDC